MIRVSLQNSECLDGSLFLLGPSQNKRLNVLYMTDEFVKQRCLQVGLYIVRHFVYHLYQTSFYGNLGHWKLCEIGLHIRIQSFSLLSESLLITLKVLWWCSRLAPTYTCSYSLHFIPLHEHERHPHSSCPHGLISFHCINMSDIPITMHTGNFNLLLGPW